MDIFTVDDVKSFIALLKNRVLENKDYLIELDSVMGDGDLGLTMAAVFTAQDEFVSSWDDRDIGLMLMKSGMIMSKAAPSTMGTLMATGFMRGGKALKGNEELGLPELTEFWKAFVEGIMDRGKAKPGEKTIIDALHPAVLSLEKSKDAGESLTEAITRAAAASAKGLEATMNMVAQHGRVAYYQEKSREIQDPGATMGNLLFQTLAEYIL